MSVSQEFVPFLFVVELPMPVLLQLSFLRHSYLQVCMLAVLQFEFIIQYNLDHMQNINPFELFKDELDTDDIASRVNTIHKVSVVATLMPVQAIKNTLLPYLDLLCKKEDDQVVFAITEEYATLAPMLGNQHTLVLPYLQALCAHDETVVRERAVNSITKILQLYSDNDINNYIIPLIIRLASNEANFTCRVSATLLMCNAYPRAGQNKEKIRHKFSDISNEEMLMLQRVTATKISQMCRVYEKEYVLSDLISILKHRSTDEQDQIRVLATESFKQISKILTRDQNKTFIMPLIIQAAQDKSWRVRLCLSKNFTEIASNFGKEVTDMSLIQTYSNLLKDSQIDVKIQAVKSLANFIKIVSPEKISYLLPHVTALGKDALAIVRSNVGGIIKNMVQSISKDQAYQNVQPLIKDLMKDDNQQVRKGGIQAAVKFIEVLGAETVTALYPSLKACSEDAKWRVRLELMRNVCSLAAKMQNYELFSKHLQPLILNFLKDRVWAIREVAIQRIGDFAKLYGPSWITGFMGKLSDVISKDPCFHFKIAAVYSLRQICMSVHSETFFQKALNLIIGASNEPVPNIREVCVKVERDIAQRFQKASVRDAIKKHISSLSEDTDLEVRITVADILNRF